MVVGAYGNQDFKQCASFFFLFFFPSLYLTFWNILFWQILCRLMNLLLPNCWSTNFCTGLMMFLIIYFIEIFSPWKLCIACFCYWYLYISTIFFTFVIVTTHFNHLKIFKILPNDEYAFFKPILKLTLDIFCVDWMKEMYFELKLQSTKVNNHSFL